MSVPHRWLDSGEDDGLIERELEVLELGGSDKTIVLAFIMFIS